MKKDWEIKKLGEVCDFKSGTTISPTLEREVGDVLYVKVGDMNLPENEIEINTSSRFVNSNEIKQAQIIPEGAVIFPKRGGAIATNKKRKVIQPTIVDLNTMAIIPTNKLYSEYFYYWFQLIDLNDISNGTTIPQINNYSFDEIFIQYPKSLHEQQRIVSILDEAFAAIAKAKANAEQNLKNAKELFESYLQGVFENGNWETKKLTEITEVKDGTHDSPKYIIKGIPFVTQKNIKPNGLSFDDTKFITDTDHEKFYKRSNVTYGDILISMIGANRGMVAIVDDKRVFSIKNVGLIKSSDNINMNYLLYYLKSSLAMKYVLFMSNGGAQEFIGLTALRSFPIPMPSLNEQQTIVRQLDALRAETQKLEAVYQQKIADLEELKKSILAKAFNGELKTNKAVSV